jgi:hypothetical protein
MSSQHVSRRAVARGAAWSVPLVAVGVAAPAFASSPGSAPSVTLLAGCRCGTGGGPIKPYRLDVTFNNATADTFTVTNVGIDVSGTPANNVALQAFPPQTNDIPPGNKTLRYTFLRGSNPASDLVTFTYTYTNTTTNVASNGSFSATVNWATCSLTCA